MRWDRSSRLQAPDLVRERRREQKILAILRQHVEYFADVADETHVEHAIRFVQHEDVHIGQPDGFLLQVVEQSPGGRDDDVDALPQGRDLRIDTDSAEDLGHPERQVAAVYTHALTYLGSQLPRRCQHEGSHPPAVRARLLQALQEGKSEAGRLTRAGLSAGKDVLAGKDVGDCPLLDRGRLAVPLVRDRAQQFGRQAELVK
jgi:hypothetical protein